MTATPPLVTGVMPPSVHVMTLNVRRRMPTFRPGSPDRWSTRRPLLERLLSRDRPGILGLQEVTRDQSEQIREMLGEDYTSTGTGRDRNRQGERVELHVDQGRFRIVDSSTWWLSDRPDVPGSRSFGTVFPRVAVQATIRDLATGAALSAVVTHFDPFSARSRSASARLVAARMDAVEGPTIVMGDFNTGVGSVTHRLLTSGRLADTLATPPAAPAASPTSTASPAPAAPAALAASRPDTDWGSYSHYRAPRRGGRRLDWILADRDATVRLAGVDPARFDGAAVSDHDPVHAVVEWPVANPWKGAPSGA